MQQRTSSVEQNKWKIEYVSWRIGNFETNYVKKEKECKRAKKVHMIYGNLSESI